MLLRFEEPWQCHKQIIIYNTSQYRIINAAIKPSFSEIYDILYHYTSGVTPEVRGIIPLPYFEVEDNMSCHSYGLGQNYKKNNVQFYIVHCEYSGNVTKTVLYLKI